MDYYVFHAHLKKINFKVAIRFMYEKALRIRQEIEKTIDTKKSLELLEKKFKKCPMFYIETQFVHENFPQTRANYRSVF